MAPAVPSITSVSTPRYVSSSPQQFTITGVNFNKKATINVGSLSNIHPTTATWTVIVPSATTLQIRIKNPNGATSPSFACTFTAQPPPAAPTNLHLTGLDQAIRLQWTGVANVSRYIIERSTVSGGERITFYTNAAQTLACDYTDAPLVTNVTYYYTVAAQNAAGTSAQSNEATLGPLPPPTNPPPVTPPPIPNPPTSLFAFAGNAQVTLTWTNGSGTVSNTLSRGLSSSGPFTSLGSRSSGYIDTGRTNGVTYYYVVTATNQSGTSGNSNVAFATPMAPAPPPTTPPATPTGLTATAGDTTVQLAWNLVTSNAGTITYHVKRSTSNGGPYSTVASVQVPNYLDTGLTDSVTYYYVVDAQNTDGTSANSSQVSATPVAVNPPPPPPPPPSGRTIDVFTGGDLQQALDAANAGDIVSIHPAVFRSVAGSQFFFRPKASQSTHTDADYILVQTSAIASLPAAGARIINPTIDGVNMPRIVGNDYGTILFTPGAHHWKLIGLDISTDGVHYTPDIVQVGGTGSANGYPTRAEILALNHITIDRCFIHPAEISASSLTTSSNIRTSGRGIHVVGCDITIENNWIGGFAGFTPGTFFNIDSYGIYSDVGFGPLTIRDNYIQANFNNIFLGGADCPFPNTATVSAATATQCTLSQSPNLAVGDVIAFYCAGAVWKSAKVTSKSGNTVHYTSYGPSGLGTTVPDMPGFAQWNGDIIHDVLIENNYLIKLAQWNLPVAQGGQGLGPQWKAFVEVKQGDTITIHNNVCDGENAWPGGAFALTARNQNGSMPWATITNLSLLDNIIRIGCGTYLAQQLEDNEKSSLGVSDWLIQGNSFEPLGPGANEAYGYAMSFLGGGGYANPKPATLTYNHNTFLNNGVRMFAQSNLVTDGVLFQNNVLFPGTYDWQCTIGAQTKAVCWPAWAGTKNLVIDVNGVSPPYPSSFTVGSVVAAGFRDYPNGNYGLLTSSVGYHAATDGTDIGADYGTIPVPPVTNARYVSTAGNDGNDGTIGAPWRHIVYGLSQISAGMTLYARAGTYNEGIASVPNGTSWSTAPTLAAYPGETVWLKPLNDSQMGGGVATVWLDGSFHYFIFDGINMDGSLTTGQVVWVSCNNGNNPHHIRIANAEIIGGLTGFGGNIAFGGHTLVPGGATGSNEAINLTIHGGGLPDKCGVGCSQYGIYLEGPNNIVDGCNIYDTASYGLQIYNAGADSPDNNIVRNTRFHDITAARSGYADGSGNGMLIAGNNNQVYNCLFYNLTVVKGSGGQAGIFIYYGDRNKIWDNTITGNTALDGIGINNLATNTEVRNNISYNNAQDWSNTGSGTVNSNNLFSVNPLFVNAGTHDYHTQNGSPARNAGVTINGIVTDIEGDARSTTPTIGCYENAS